jgi:hypothetical protein
MNYAVQRNIENFMPAMDGKVVKCNKLNENMFEHSHR